MRKEHFCEKLLDPEKPEEALPAAVELLLIEPTAMVRLPTPTFWLSASGSMSCMLSTSP